MPYFTYENHRVFYSEMGTGEPLFLLHGNTASSKMFLPVLDLYCRDFKLVWIDFLGHGKSDRLPAFPVDLWFDEAIQVIKLIETLKYQKVHILGSSGGALVGLNVALERPDLVNKVVADSFEGEYPLKDFTDNVLTERERGKEHPDVREFYIYNHGQDWEGVVDNDSHAIDQHARTVGRFFHKPLEEIQAEVLLTANKADPFAPPGYFTEVYGAIAAKMKKGRVHLFDGEEHPALLSNKGEFARVALGFLKE